MRLDEDYEAPKALFTSCPVRKSPPKREYVRVHPDPAYRMEIGLIILDQSDETYALAPKIAKRLPEEDFTRCMIYTAINRGGSVFLWRVRQPSRDGKLMECHRVLHEAAGLCASAWHRVTWSEGNRNYKIIAAKPGVIPEPDWSEIPPFQAILRTAFQSRHL